MIIIKKSKVSYLKGTNGLGLEAEIGFEILGNFTNKSLEGQLSDQEFGRLLVTTNLTKGNGTWSVSVRLLDTASRWGGFTGGLKFEIKN